MHRGHVTCGAVVLALLPGIAVPTRAQVVRGTVVDEESRAAVPSAVIVLLDGRGTRVAGALTDEAGRFAILAPGAGSYALRVERIGYRGITSAPFSLSLGQRVEQLLAIPVVPRTLAGIVVRGRERCVVRPEDDDQVSRVWEEVRTALDAAVVTREQRLVRLTLERYDRYVAPHGGAVRRERRWTQSVMSASPFVSAPAESLAARGFVWVDRDTVTYFAPDAVVLASESFAETHCLRLRDGDARHRGMIGVEFEPARGRTLPGVHGVLWVDAQTAELRVLEYTYTPLPPGASAEQAGGRVEFGRLSSGAWIVTRWSIRMPIFGLRESSIPGQGPETRVVMVHDVGGEVREAVSVAAGPVAAGTQGESVRGVPVHADSAVRARSDSTVAAHPDSAAAHPEPAGAARPDSALHAATPAVQPAGDVPQGRTGPPSDLRSGRGRASATTYLDRAAIERRGALTLTDLLSTVPGVRVLRNAGPGGSTVVQATRVAVRTARLLPDTVVTDSAALGSIRPSSRSQSLAGGRVGVAGDPLAQLGPPCRAAFFVDGREVDPETANLDATLRPEEIEALAVYVAGTPVPAELASPHGTCGTIVLWTTR
jgi:hypothetical protein